MFLTVGVASAALITPKSPTRHITSFDESVSVYRPADRAWIETSLEELQPLDFLLKDGRAYQVNAAYSAAAGQVQAVPLGTANLAELERHLGNYDPEDESYPQSDIELVYAKWEGTDLWTFQPLGKLQDGDLFQHNGREFITRVALDGSRSVKPTGNVISQVTGVWSEHHENQIHLTLFFPEIGETNQIITTHEHPFYVPLQDAWIPAESLTVGTDLQTCDGTPARVAKWVLIDEPITAWNIEVANSHTYYVSDPNNPDAPPVLVHNACATANQIAQGHAYQKHVLSRKEFDDLNITSQTQFADLLEDVMKNPTHSGQLARGRSYAYDANRNILVVKDPNSRDFGTAFRPANGLAYVQGLQ